MKIAIVTTRSLLSEFKESHQSVSSNLLELLSTLGLYPIVLSNNEFGLSDLIELLDPSLIVLSGGENFGDNATRDEFEFGLLEIAENKSIPVIGICRGMQIMCIYGGGTIKNIDGHVGVSHKINQIHTDQMVPVNSFHNNGIDFLPEIFKVNCKAEDDSIESFYHITLPWLCIKWHPERENGMNSNDIFIKFMNNL